MTVFCDTSAFYAISSPEDECHGAAIRTWSWLADGTSDLVTTNYTVVETVTLLQRRFGLHPVRVLLGVLKAATRVAFIDPELHEAALAECLRSDSRRVSFVDYVSFEFMRRNAIETAFTFDKHFEERGFKQLSPPRRLETGG